MASAHRAPSRIVGSGKQAHLEVDGEPYFILGGQVHNSSAYTASSMEPLWDVLVRIGANTAEVPVYWEQLEPAEGQYDFGMVDALLAGAEEHDLRLVLLWFASWKNGVMTYTPAWLKAAPGLYWRTLGPDGQPVNVISPHCDAARDRDARAYSALLAHLAEADTTHRVVAVQVQNEPGALGAVRDHRPEAEALFQSDVPAEITELLRCAPGALNAALASRWEAAGCRRSGTWPEVFGASAGELFNAYYTARYIDSIAAAGKAVYPLPAVVNVWLGEQGWREPGHDYPSGGATTTTLDIWKVAAPHVDLIAPDIYHPSASEFRAICSLYARPDNLLFIPESPLGPSTAANLFYAIGEFAAIGIAPFGIDGAFDPSGQPTEHSRALLESYAAVRAILPLLFEARASGRLHPLVQEEGMDHLQVQLEGAVALVQFLPDRYCPLGQRGRGLLVQTGPKEYYVAGIGLRVCIRPDGGGGYPTGPRNSHLIPFILIEEGYFKGCTWVRTSQLNGDEATLGLQPRYPGAVVHAVLE
ncbi:MAG: DUF5597 domain-containing protein [Chloroflexota bacterium]|nr:DUF5597 domain-containing protein [Chloroflexota bacterium]